MSATSLLGDRLLKSPCSTEAASSAFAMSSVRLPGAGAGVGVGVGVGSGWYGLGKFGGDGAAARHGEIPEGFGGGAAMGVDFGGMKTNQGHGNGGGGNGHTGG